jgi:two-component system, NarL family, sensor histidine kinase DesK
MPITIRTSIGGTHGFPKKGLGWVAYIWLVYLVFFVWDPIVNPSLSKTLATLAGLALFLCCYFGMFLAKKPVPWFCIAGMVLLGLAYAPFNGGAACFFIYSASFFPFLVDTELKAIVGILSIASAAAVEAWLLHLGTGFGFPAVFLTTFIGAGNVYFAQRNRHIEKLRLANDEIEHLAKVAERERIARDLHDVLGHTLTLIALKSELAGKLIDRNPEQARAEIHEVEEAARTSLAEVRQAILGYRAKGLSEEFKQAKATLETAGVEVRLDSPSVQLPASHESVLSLVLREAVTNVVRHAGARHCLLRLERVNGHCKLEVHDDGRGGVQVEGNGLCGMRERVEELGGTLERNTAEGTRILITLPVPSNEEYLPV